MNVRVYDTGVKDMVDLQAALLTKEYTGGALRDNSVSAMIDVSSAQIQFGLCNGHTKGLSKISSLPQTPMGNKIFELLKDQAAKKPELLVLNLREGIMRVLQKR